MNLADDLKNILIKRIENINDLNYLQALQTILDSSNQALFELTQDQIESIAASRKDLAEGNVKNNELLLSQLSEWIKRK